MLFSCLKDAHSINDPDNTANTDTNKYVNHLATLEYVLFYSDLFIALSPEKVMPGFIPFLKAAFEAPCRIPELL